MQNISVDIQKQEAEISKPYQDLLERISHRYVEGQAQAVRSVNENMVDTNWHIGKYIVEYEQGGKQKAEYGKRLLEKLSKDLTLLHGKGFSRSNLQRMRQFYIVYPICATPSHKLTWSHWVELLKVSDKYFDNVRQPYFQKVPLIEKRTQLSLSLIPLFSANPEGLDKVNTCTLYEVRSKGIRENGKWTTLLLRVLLKN